MQFLLQLTVIHPALLSRPETTVKIENPPYMSLTVENIGLGPRGLPALSICHYGELNGDLMRDPEMCFELSNPLGMGWILAPYYFRNDYMGVEQYSRNREGENYVFVRDLLHQHESFARTWDKNIRAQGFVEAFERSRNQ